MPKQKTTVGKTPLRSTSPEPAPDFAALIDRYLDDLEAVAAAESLRPQRSSRQHLQSYPPPQEELDLHGLTAVEAEKAIHRFIAGCRELRLATLRIITGKGLHSPGPPVLPPVAEAALVTMKDKKMVADFRWEKRRQSRGGALIVYLP